MNIQLNGKPHSTMVDTLTLLLDEAGYGGAAVATAVNGSFIPLTQRTYQALRDGDQIEVLAPMQGG